MLRLFLFTLMFGFSTITSAATTAQKPLLIDGKKTLFQRILTTPGAQIVNQPGEASDSAQTPTLATPFTAHYVYQRQTRRGEQWLQLGTDRHGSVVGWLKATESIEWNQGLTAAFRNPIGRDRTLLFREKAALRDLTLGPDIESYKKLYQEAITGMPSKNSPVVAIQPEGDLDIHESFYLVPIHSHEDVYLGSEQARMLKVSSVPLSESTAAPVTSKATFKPVEQAPIVSRKFNTGLAFTIDSTLSMDPYIKRTRQAVKKIYDHLDKAKLAGNVNFGLTAFRDDPNASRGLEYRTHTFVTLKEGGDSDTFLSKVNKLSAARTSSRDFKEDVYAGVKETIDAMNWAVHDARYLVLITDAGPRTANDPLSGTGMSATSLRQLALDKGIAIFVLHLLTPAKKADHAAAAREYKALSDYPGIGSFYYGVQTGDIYEFGKVLDALAAQITEQVQLVSAGKLEADSIPGTEASPQVAETTHPASENNELRVLQSKISKLGYALQMKYLRQSKDEQVPKVFNAWMLDKDFEDPERTTLDIRVLLTRDQLSDLHDVLRQVLNTAEEGLLSPRNFLNELKSLAATISRNPELIGTTTATTAGQGNSLADLGFMREYIEDLPYTGEVMTLSLEDWRSWSANRQIAFLHRLEEKISYYRALHDHTDLWVSLDGGAVDGDSVFPVALEMLP